MFGLDVKANIFGRGGQVGITGKGIRVCAGNLLGTNTTVNSQGVNGSLYISCSTQSYTGTKQYHKLRQGSIL